MGLSISQIETILNTTSSSPLSAWLPIFYKGLIDGSSSYLDHRVCDFGECFVNQSEVFWLMLSSLLLLLVALLRLEWLAKSTRGTMTTLVWNCQGIGQALTGKGFKELLYKYKSFLVFLMETKQHCKYMCRL